MEIEKSTEENYELMCNSKSFEDSLKLVKL